ncbi:MAG: hypothetical protein VX438_17840 [Planctomycetota bacterium]|jgi:hypothetical protein|nr:hypothetical protein [Planctomycetota bacterium]
MYELFVSDFVLFSFVPALFGTFWDGRWWYAFPLIVSISLVYGATRHEHLVPILMNAYKSAAWIVIFMAIIFLLIWIIGMGL